MSQSVTSLKPIVVGLDIGKSQAEFTIDFRRDAHLNDWKKYPFYHKTQLPRRYSSALLETIMVDSSLAPKPGLARSRLTTFGHTVELRVHQ